jgi:hypothetical protein
VRVYQDIRERLGLGDDCEILEVRRPALQNSMPLGRQQVIMLGDSPARHRELPGNMLPDRLSMPASYGHLSDPRADAPRQEIRYAAATPEPAVFVRRLDQGRAASQPYREPPMLENRRPEAGPVYVDRHGYVSRPAPAHQTPPAGSG